VSGQIKRLRASDLLEKDIEHLAEALHAESRREYLLGLVHTLLEKVRWAREEDPGHIFEPTSVSL